MKRYNLFFFALGTMLLAFSCNRVEIIDDKDTPLLINSTIEGACLVEESLPPLATKALIDQITTQSMKANFVRIDEDVVGGVGSDKNDGTYTFLDGAVNKYLTVNWERAYLLEASVISSPDNTAGAHLRSITFDPVQSYKIIATTDAQNIPDTTHFYHTRMVGWYPQNCILPRKENGKAVYTLLDDHRYSTIVEKEEGISGRYRVGVSFTGLDGSKDVMVSNVKEGQHWHTHNPQHPGDVSPIDGSDTYHTPFGHNSSKPTYSNYFTYKHYLSAVRVWAYAEQSQQNLNMWGLLRNVTLQNQPHTCKIWLPEELDNEYGEVYSWEDYAKTAIIRTPMYGDDTNHDDENYSANYPISIAGAGSAAERVYLGYALIKPDSPLSLELDTENGVYVVEVPKTYTDKNGDDVSIFHSGYVYDVMLNLQTSGTIAVLLENESNEHFFDLTTLKEFEVGGQNVYSYKYSNCYIISPNDTSYQRKIGPDQYVSYDGYCFSATTIGNGQSGILLYGSQTMYPTSASITPTSARLVWESSLGLVSDIELLYGYVRFRLPDDGRRGNAVIAVYDSNDKLLWSWHIWITDKVSEQEFDTGTSTLTFLDRNIGATKSSWTGAGDVLETYGLYYQWGRKDPSMGPKTYNYSQVNLICADYYDFSSELHTSAEVRQFPRPTLKDGVENPMYFILPSDKYEFYDFDWLYGVNNLLWGYDMANGAISKTIYDPCPFGYRVPGNELGTLFTNSSYTGGQNFGQIHSDGTTDFYFPYVGFKGVDKGLNSLVGEWKYVGLKGDYQSAIYNDGDDNKYQRARVYISKANSWNEPGVGRYDNAYVTQDFTNRRTAAPVRCVKDENFGVITTDLAINPAVLIAGSNMTISTYALSSGVSVLKTKLLYKYQLIGQPDETEYVVEENDNFSGAIWDKDYTITIPDQAFLNNTTGTYTFEFSATNQYGVSNTSTVTAAIFSVGAEYIGWSPHLEGASAPVVGQPVDVSVRINSSSQLSLSSVYINGVKATYTGGSGSGSAFSVIYAANTFFTSAGDNIVPVTANLTDGTSVDFNVTVPVNDINIESVTLTDWSPKLNGYAGPVQYENANYTIKVTSNTDNITATINGAASTSSNVISGGKYVTTLETTATSRLTASGTQTIPVVLTYGTNLSVTRNVPVTVEPFAVSEVRYTTWSSQLTGATGPVVGQPVALSIQTVANADILANVTIQGGGTSVTTAPNFDPAEGYTTTYTNTNADRVSFNTKGNTSVPVVITYDDGSIGQNVTRNVTVPVNGIILGNQLTSAGSINTNSYYILYNTNFSTRYLSPNTAETGLTTSASYDFSNLFTFNSNSGSSAIYNVKAGKYLYGTSTTTYGIREETNPTTSTTYTLNYNNNNSAFRIYYRSGNTYYCWKQTDDTTVRIQTSRTTGNRLWEIISVSFDEP